MITVAIAEVFYFVESNPLSDFTGGENGFAGRFEGRAFGSWPYDDQFDTDWSMYAFLESWLFVGIATALRIVARRRRDVRAIRDNRCAPPPLVTISTVVSSPPSSLRP